VNIAPLNWSLFATLAPPAAQSDVFEKGISVFKTGIGKFFKKWAA
jgi:hypothetical protein